MNFQTHFDQHGHQTISHFCCAFLAWLYFVDSLSYLKPRLVPEENNPCSYN